MSIFLSYSRLDETRAIPLARALIEAGVALWVDRFKLTPGKPWDTEVSRALEESNGVIVLLSPNSVSSENVLDEIHYAVQNRKKIVPVILDPCKLPLRIARLHYISATRDFDATAEEIAKEFGSQPTRPTGEAVPYAPRIPSAGKPIPSKQLNVEPIALSEAGHSGAKGSHESRRSSPAGPHVGVTRNQASINAPSVNVNVNVNWKRVGWGVALGAVILVLAAVLSPNTVATSGSTRTSKNKAPTDQASSASINPFSKSEALRFEDLHPATDSVKLDIRPVQGKAQLPPFSPPTQAELDRLTSELRKSVQSASSPNSVPSQIEIARMLEKARRIDDDHRRRIAEIDRSAPLSEWKLTAPAASMPASR